MKLCNFSFFSVRKASEIYLFTSERENGSWVAYGELLASSSIIKHCMIYGRETHSNRHAWLEWHYGQL